jgi:hypothetical protein
MKNMIEVAGDPLILIFFLLKESRVNARRRILRTIGEGKIFTDPEEIGSL